MPSCTVTVRAVRHAVGDEHRADRFRRADEAVDLAILPARHRAVAQVEVDAARGDERRLGELRAHRQRQAGHRHAVRIVGVDDVGLELLEQARQPPRRAEIHLGLRRERDEVQAFLRALPQLAARMRDEHRAMAERAQAEDGDQHLVLPTTPRPRRVDVEREHLLRESVNRIGRTDAAGLVDRSTLGVRANFGRRRALLAPGASPALERAAAALQLPELQDLEEDVVRVEDRDQEARRAVAKAARAGCSCAGTPPADARRLRAGSVRRPSAYHSSAASVV